MRRLLIAEDDPATVGLYRMVLQEEEALHYDATFVSTPAECLKALAGQGHTPYDVLLMDLGLADLRPGEQHVSILEQLCAEPALRSRRLLVVSGISPYALQGKREVLTTLEAAFLPKPFDIDELLIAVRSLCEVGEPPASCLSYFVASLRRVWRVWRVSMVSRARQRSHPEVRQAAPIR